VLAFIMLIIINNLVKKKYMVYYKMLNGVRELNVEHVLMLAIVAFVLYHFMSSCGCRGNGFSVGGQPAPPHQPHMKCWKALQKTGCTQQGGPTCDMCAGQHQSSLMKAGCKQKDFTDYCKP